MSSTPVYAVGLDAGGRWTRLVICLLENNRLRFLSASEVPSQGWVKGKIADQQAVAACVEMALREAEKRAGVSVGSATVGVGGPTVRGANGRGVVELGHMREVEQRDVNRVVDRASRVQLQEDRMVLQLFPQDFVVDDHPGHRDPRKMLAQRLEINVHLVTASIQEHNSIIGAVNQAHLSVEETVFEPLAACYAAVLPEHRREGIALVDVGAQSTEMVVYYGDSMQLASTVRISADHFTRDLAQGLTLSFEDAELVKHEYGGALASNVPENIEVELPTPENRESRSTTRQFVNSILEARAEELFKFVRAELARVGMDRSLIGGVCLSGGGAMMPDLCEVAERVLQCQTRYGLVMGIQDWPEEMASPAWTTAAGLTMYSGKIKSQMAQEKQSVGLLARMMR